MFIKEIMQNITELMQNFVNNTFLKNSLEKEKLKKENEEMDVKILEAKKEIAWLKMTLEMNRYGRDADTIISISSRKIEEIEDILNK